MSLSIWEKFVFFCLILFVSWFDESLVFELSFKSCLLLVTVLLMFSISWMSIHISFVSWVINLSFILVWLFLYVWCVSFCYF